MERDAITEAIRRLADADQRLRKATQDGKISLALATSKPWNRLETMVEHGENRN